MAEKESKIKGFLDWAHHFYWIRELLISLGAGTALQAWTARIWTLSWDWRLAIWLIGSGLLFWLLTSFIARQEYRKKIPDEDKNNKDIFQEIKDDGIRWAYCALLHFDAEELIERLDALRFHWDNAGEKLIHPLNSIDKIKNCESGQVLLDEARDFRTLYLHHLWMLWFLTENNPDFTSGVVANPYPSAREYPAVHSDLVDHSAKLQEFADKIKKID